MRRPGGAVLPATKAKTGLVMRSLMNRAASSSAEPPISPIMTTASVCRIGLEQRQDVHEIHALHGVAAYADHGGLAQALAGQLPDRLVGERAGAGDHADMPFLVDVAGHDAGFAFAGVMTPGQLGPTSVRRGRAQRRGLFHAHHVQHRDALGDADYRFDAGVGGLQDGVGGERRRHEDQRGVGAGALHGFLGRIEDRCLEVRGPAFAGRHAAHDIAAVFQALPGVESALRARDAVHHEFGSFVKSMDMMLPRRLYRFLRPLPRGSRPVPASMPEFREYRPGLPSRWCLPGARPGAH